MLAMFSPSLMAAGKCTEIRTESTFDLINAPVEEMQDSRNATAINCVIIKDFVARFNKAKPGMPSAPVQSAPTTSSNGSYVPKTKDDNTPWRFDMNQNGKRMTAEEFDAWMKAKGIHVATGKPGTESSTPPPPVDCKPGKDTKC